MHLPLLRSNLPSLFNPNGASGRLTPLNDFGTNPGNLKSWFYVPEREAGVKLPMVVVLHGCTQTAASYDKGSGWSELASVYGFATLFPEQQRTNNPNLCFNWFEPGDTRRAAGEALSIAEMILTMIAQHGIDPERVFITGLSAGGAMTSVMLANYPELFAGGAIIAGLPHGAATNVPEALQQMRAHSPSRRTTGQSIQAASPHRGPWPTVSVWHGSGDTVVSPSNADAILQQWHEVHEMPGGPEEDLVAGFPRRTWRDQKGRPVLEEYRVIGMGHGTPLAASGEDGYGQAGPFMLEVGISSTVQSAKTWGLLTQRRQKVSSSNEGKPDTDSAPVHPVGGATSPIGDRDRITRIIEDALKAAGLIK